MQIIHLKRKINLHLVNPWIVFSGQSARSPRLRVKYLRRIVWYKEISGQIESFSVYFPAATKTEATGKRERERNENAAISEQREGRESIKPTDAFIAFNRLSISVEFQFSTRAKGRKRR
jgi:hypothetical protein